MGTELHLSTLKSALHIKSPIYIAKNSGRNSKTVNHCNTVAFKDSNEE